MKHYNGTQEDRVNNESTVQERFLPVELTEPTEEIHGVLETKGK
jgi:hypothetical protein